MKESGGDWLFSITRQQQQQQLVLHVDMWGTPTVMAVDGLDQGVALSWWSYYHVMEMRRELSSVSILAGGL